MISRARLASTTRPCRYDSSAASMPASCSGESVGAYVRRRRLERCYADLVSGRAGSVAEIAVRWGFRSSSHFSRVFRRCYGAAPREVLGAGHLEGSHAQATAAR